MRARYKEKVFVTEDEVRKAVRAQVEETMPQVFEEVEANTAYQVLATVFHVLSRDFGFGKKRLNRLKDMTEHEFMLMERGVLGRDYSASDCCKHLKDKYGIDFGQSVFTGKEAQK